MSVEVSGIVALAFQLEGKLAGPRLRELKEEVLAEPLGPSAHANPSR